MKIRTLFLKAFGPFTETTLDFSGPANLHLIYGANEAGKSSALRAMGDLRYGIPARSSDNFVHEFKDMRLAGCFEDAAGRAIGLARRKGHHDTLMPADPATGAVLTGAAPVSPEVLLALTGGVAREQFETMHGLDSAHLRRGGQLLIQGEGELGAALFEASTGSAGIRQMLETLQLDAKKFFAPRGQLPILNESARQLEEARHRYKQAVTKPDQWKTLRRAHEEAKSHLDSLRTALAGQRARLAELAELRAVEPLLHQLALTSQAWTQVQHHVALPPEAGERRREALQQQVSARQACSEAEAALAECRAAAQALRIEPLLLTHASAIDRLVADLALVRHGREERIRLQAAADAQAGQLGLQAAQIMGPDSGAPALEEFFRRAPSAADQAEVARLLDECKTLAQALAHAQERQDASLRKLEWHRREGVQAPAPALQQALSLALAQAQALGDAPRRLAELQAALQAGQRRLGIALADLGLASAAQLGATRWLASAEIDGHEHARRELQQQAALGESDLKKLQADLLAQQRRHKTLCATGEVVSAQTLRAARAERDAGWQGLRGAFIDRESAALAAVQDAFDGACADAVLAEVQHAPEHRRRLVSGDLVRAFEHAQAQADRQADLLREGAARAAEMAECEQRMAEMAQALAELEGARSAQAQALATLDAAWRETLAQRGIPHATAPVVREWQALRQSALERQEHLAEAEQAHAALARQMSAATESLRAALQALQLLAPQGGKPQAASPQGAAPHEALAQDSLPQGDMAWQALIALGTEADRRLLAQRVALEERASAMASLAQDIEEDGASVARLTQLLQACQHALDAKARLLYLPAGTAAETLKARLAELQRWVQDYQRHVEHLQQVRAMKDSEEATLSGAHALGQLLQEPVGEHPEAWLDALALRLARTREALQIQEERERREAEEIKRQQRAQAELESAAQALAQLLAQAGVSQVDELPPAEARAEQRREVAARLRELQAQLARTSEKDAERLRAELAGLDSSAIDSEKQACAAEIARLEADEKAAIEAEQAARAALARIDTSDEAAQAREAMEAAIARYRAGVRPWARLKLAEALLAEALRRHREKAQGPVLALASEYFRLMTGGRFTRLLADADSATPVLLAQPVQGRPMAVAALSEGTADQLYLALRLAALQVQRQPERMMPLVLDDVFMTADDARAACMFRALEKFAATTQVMVFTHHRHLLDLAAQAVAGQGLRIHALGAALR